MAATNSSVTKALEVLDLLGQAAHPVRLKDIADRLDLPESTTHRLLASLAERGYVQRRADSTSYALGWKIVVLARSLASDAHLVQDMRPYLVRLVRQLGQTVNLAVLSNHEVMYLDCQTPVGSLALYMAPGVTFPMHATSLGKILLAYQTQADIDGVIARLPLPRLTPTTITDREQLRSSLEAIRQQGYALDHGELRPDVCCLAAPLLDDSGIARAAISMTAHRAELPPDWETTFPSLVMNVAKEASLDMFHHRP